MSLLDVLLSRRTNTAYIAKKRLQMIFLKKKKCINYSDHFIKLKKEILFIVEKYIQMKPNIISVRANQKDPNIFILKLHVIKKNDI
ncbi:cell division topological specificity factor MinE [Buchnera aphidicola]|uniref:Cell division topological specificity factor n=1 Tax=Buchnera aphidicola (Sarucallis kahawaluokalani) TaxID=1241878 RepID=A0A4D6YD22_9GAMM|nr:cell division topological specificity factor MinE [Buchnera aphidicola]QCI26023.1 cell division topological specificity factor MinE [Buchnera aphidicola (Sarucallis kahawaluokalani)]